MATVGFESNLVAVLSGFLRRNVRDISDVLEDKITGTLRWTAFKRLDSGRDIVRLSMLLDGDELSVYLYGIDGGAGTLKHTARLRLCDPNFLERLEALCLRV